MYLRRSHVTPSCVNHHTDLFVQYFQAFSSAIWTLLAAIGASGSSLKFQEVAVAALHFFSSVCTKQLFREAFQSGDMLQQLISNVISSSRTTKRFFISLLLSHRATKPTPNDTPSPTSSPPSSASSSRTSSLVPVVT